MVLDVLKPHSPTIVDLARRIAALKGVQGVNCTIEEVDQETESLSVTIEGEAIDFDKVDEVIKQTGAVIHSVDSVSAGKKKVEDGHTPG